MSSRQFRLPVGKNGTIMPESSLVAPESLNGSVDYNAFTPPEKATLHLGIFPQCVVNDIRSEQRVEVRRAAINTIHESLQETKDNLLLIDMLQGIITLIVPSLKDSNFKIVLVALEIISELIDRTGTSLLPYLPTLLSNYLDKVWSHKFVVKQAGMKVLLHMMSSLTPSPVIDQVIQIGINHKQGKVREETLNIIIASLLTFPKTEFSLPHLVERVTPLLTDSRQKVRQACLELCAVLADRLGKEKLHSLLSAIINIQTTVTDTENLHVAFQSRLSRQQLPEFNSDGLVDHIVNVANGRSTGELRGSDVDWILAGKSSSPGINSRKQSTSGPLRSAGKKLPWDKEQPKGGYASMAMKQQFSSNGLGPPTPTLGATGAKPKGYSDIYRSSNESSDGVQFNGSFITASSFKILKANSNPSNSKGSVLGSLSTTWPRQNNYGSNHHFMKTTVTTTTARQISADSSALGSNLLSQQAKLPAISNRPSSKPIVRNPLDFRPQPPPPFPSPPSSHATNQPLLSVTTNNQETTRVDSPTLIEESFLFGGGGDDDAEYFNIPVDESQLNSSLSSSLTSLLFSRDVQPSSAAPTTTGDRTKDEVPPHPRTVDSLSQIRKKAANIKAEILSTQCSTSTSPVSTPPRTHKLMASSNNRLEPEAVSAPIVLKRTTLKEKDSSVPLFGSPHFQLNDSGPYHESFNTRTTRTSRSSNNEQLLLKTNPMKAVFKSPPRHMSIVEDTEQLYVNDLELNPEFISPPRTTPIKDITPPNRKIKKLSPTKAASAPHKSFSNTLAGNSASNSAPVYRPGQQEPTEEDTQPANKIVVELSPLSNPESALRKALEGLAKEDWAEKIDSLLLLRRLAACHTKTILPQLPTVLYAVEKEVKNLRSQVARNAIACLGDIFGYLGKDIDMSLDSIIKSLLHVGSKSNTFYKEDTEKAMNELCTRTQPVRILQALMNGGLHHCNQAVRRQVAQFMCTIIEHHGAAKIIRLQRDVLDRIINATSSLLSDADPLARYFARKMMCELYTCTEFELHASRVLASHQFVKMRDINESIKVKGLGKPPSDSQSAKSTRSSTSQFPLPPPSSSTSNTLPHPLSSSTGVSPPKQRKRRSSAAAAFTGTTQPILNEPSAETNATIMSIVTRMKANDWKERQEAISELEELIVSSPNCLGGSNLVKVFDVFNERLSDKNSKVNLHALQAFQTFVGTIRHQLQPVLPTLVEALAGTVASRYPAIHSAALDAVDALIGAVECTLIFPPLASAAQNGNARVQPIMLRKLAELIPTTYNQKPSLVQRVGLPVLWKVLAARSPATGEAKSANLKLLEVLHKCMGPSLEAIAAQQPPAQQQKLRDMLYTLRHR